MRISKSDWECFHGLHNKVGLVLLCAQHSIMYSYVHSKMQLCPQHIPQKVMNIANFFNLGMNSHEKVMNFHILNIVATLEIEAVTGCTFAYICYTVFACSLVYKLTVSHFISASFWNSIHLIGWSKFILKPRARVWYRSNQCLVFPLCCCAYSVLILWEKMPVNTHFHRIREGGCSGRPPPPTVHLRTDDVT